MKEKKVVKKIKEINIHDQGLENIKEGSLKNKKYLFNLYLTIISVDLTHANMINQEINKKNDMNLLKRINKNRNKIVDLTLLQKILKKIKIFFKL